MHVFDTSIIVLDDFFAHPFITGKKMADGKVIIQYSTVQYSSTYVGLVVPYSRDCQPKTGLTFPS